MASLSLIGVRVLVADAEAPLQTALRQLFESLGSSVCEAADGYAALHMLRTSQQPLVAVVGFHLPRLNGAQLLAHVARTPELAQRHTVILLTQSSHELPPLDVTLHLEQIGGVQLAKPLDASVAVNAVAQAWQRLTRRTPLPPGLALGPE